MNCTDRPMTGGCLCVVCETTEPVLSCFTIELYDSSSRLIERTEASSNKTNHFLIPRREEYRIKVISHGKIGPASASRWVKLNPLCSRTEYFLFVFPPRGPAPSRNRFMLTDAYYPGLPIERGMLLFRSKKNGTPFCVKKNIQE